VKGRSFPGRLCSIRAPTAVELQQGFHTFGVLPGIFDKFYPRTVLARGGPSPGYSEGE